MTQIEQDEKTQVTTEEEAEKQIKRATRQTTERTRYSSRAPGWFPVAVDIVIHLSLQLALVVASFFLIFSTFAYTGDAVGWLILMEIIFTYVGFGVFVRKISQQILVYKKFFLSLNEWHDRKLEEITNGGSSCCCFWFILLKLVWWICALFLFPIIIGWSMVQSCKWHKNRRRNAESAIDITQLENVTDAKQFWKMSDNAYSVWHLGVLSNQASMIVCFIQDIPLLIISIFILNYFGIIVFTISIVIKLLCWFKHMYDLGNITLFYKPEHYLDHFGIASITWSNEYGIPIIVPTFYTQREREMSTLQVGDWVRLDAEEKQESYVMIVWKSRPFKKVDNLVLIDFDKVDKKAMEDYSKGLTKKLVIDDDAVHVVNRWDGNVELLRDEDYAMYHDNDGNVTVNVDNNSILEAMEQTETVIVAVTGDTIVTEVENVTQVTQVTQVKNDESKEKIPNDIVDVDMNDEEIDEIDEIDADIK